MQNTSPPQPKFNLSPKVRNQLIKAGVIAAFTIPPMIAIAIWGYSSTEKRKVAPVAQFNEGWALTQINSDYLASQQQINLFLNGNDSGEMGQSSRLIRAEAQRMALTVDKFRADKKHPCYRMSRDGCLDTIETSIEREWNDAAIKLDNSGMARALFRYQAVTQARSGQIDSVDTRPNLFVAAIRKMRTDRQVYQQQTAEAQAGNQLSEQRQAEQEFNRQQQLNGGRQ
ncbi:hypothetical protein [Kamptonema sp. UHCC 0994]|uniref:hypothetical protein n=1 Tax=Kamptonema sp. UHCC 0994 TaxID=3031329 RepID=UPI0023BAD260|nr:hypothetical protein [Kamptonema sp. UHCC 0994]MDF0556569.1 hypothetical protein [Kamptonema sp. UHCC 0994]